MTEPLCIELTGVPFDAVGAIQVQEGRPAIIDLRGRTTLRVQAFKRDNATWGATVIAIQYRLGSRMKWVEIDTAQRISAAGIFPTGGGGYDVTGYAEAQLYIVTAGSSGAQGDVAMYAEATL